MRNWIQGVLIAGAGMVLAASAVGQATADTSANTGPQAGAGIWKAVVPKQTMYGEFDNHDPIGVAAGARVKADCSLNWVDPDDGKLYCFSSGTSLEMFLELPQAHIERARRAWAAGLEGAPDPQP
jgi:hypothetical protein